MCILEQALKAQRACRGADLQAPSALSTGKRQMAEWDPELAWRMREISSLQGFDSPPAKSVSIRYND